MLGVPRDWQPYSVIHPSYAGSTFTDQSAFEFIADCLEAGHEFEELMLDVPKGALAIVLKINMGPTTSMLYVKLQVGKGNLVIGRSFHYSDYFKGFKNG